MVKKGRLEPTEFISHTLTDKVLEIAEWIQLLALQRACKLTARHVQDVCMAGAMSMLLFSLYNLRFKEDYDVQ